MLLKSCNWSQVTVDRNAPITTVFTSASCWMRGPCTKKNACFNLQLIRSWFAINYNFWATAPKSCFNKHSQCPIKTITEIAQNVSLPYIAHLRRYENFKAWNVLLFSIFVFVFFYFLKQLTIQGALCTLRWECENGILEISSWKSRLKFVFNHARRYLEVILMYLIADGN